MAITTVVAELAFTVVHTAAFESDIYWIVVLMDSIATSAVLTALLWSSIKGMTVLIFPESSPNWFWRSAISENAFSICFDCSSNLFEIELNDEPVAQTLFFSRPIEPDATIFIALGTIIPRPERTGHCLWSTSVEVHPF